MILLKEAILKARALERKFNEKLADRREKWDGKTLLIDLMEEVGELSNAVLVAEGAKSEKRRKAELGDSFADVLLAVILLADAYGVDIEKEYGAALEQINSRIDAGKF